MQQLHMVQMRDHVACLPVRLSLWMRECISASAHNTTIARTQRPCFLPHLALPHARSAVVASDDDCSTYFRTCGGLQAAASLLIIRTAVALPALPCKPGAGSSGKDANCTPGGAAAKQQEELLALLATACSNAVSLEQVAADEKLLASSHGAVRARAAQLLFSASTAGGARQAACGALAARQGAGLADLLAMLPAAAAATQVRRGLVARGCMASGNQSWLIPHTNTHS